MKLIVGLGNPGREYERTRHNAGFMVVDLLADKLDIKVNQLKFKGIAGEGRVNGEKVVLLKPLTYMNLSGESIIQAVQFYKLNMDELVVIYDDLDIPPGQVRLRLKGSAGGHNGMKSIIQHLNTDEFNRVRVGIGRPAPGRSVVDFVLDAFSREELSLVIPALEKATDAVEYWLSEPFDKVMNKYN